VKIKFTRRAVVKSALAMSTIIPSIGLIGRVRAAPADLPPLDPKDPQAVTLGFVLAAGKVDATANPMYATGQSCANCMQFLGSRSESRGGCVLFAGKSVPSAGWCKVWRKVA
jgi:hypothetical protein